VYTYDANRLTSVTSGTLTTAFEYDGLGNRVAQTVDGVETRYTLDVAGGLPEVIVATTDGASTYYVQIQGQILGQEESGKWAYVLPDHLGSALGGSWWTPRGRCPWPGGSYDPFGVPFEASGSGASDFGYTGEWWGSYNDLLFLRARYYDPAVGRFLSKDRFTGFDTLPQTQHSFAYVTNNPANRVDPSGYAGGPAGQAVQLCLRSAPTCASLLAAGATILLELGPWVLIAVPVAYIITHPAPVTEPDVLPEPVPEPQPAPARPLPGVTPYPDTTGTGEDPFSLPPIYQRAPEPKPKRTPIPAPFDPRREPATPPATCTPASDHKFYFKDVGSFYNPIGYPPPGRNTATIAAGLKLYVMIPGVDGSVGQLEGAQALLNNQNGAAWTENILMGRKFESERTIFFASRNALERMNSTAEGYDLIPRNFKSIQYIQVKWSRGPIPASTISKVVMEARTHPSGSYLLESNNIDINAHTLLKQHGGEGLPYSYP
jgi:RHS repeat-associated protein